MSKASFLTHLNNLVQWLARPFAAIQKIIRKDGTNIEVRHQEKKKKKEIQTIVKIVLYKNGLDLTLHIHNFRLALSNFTVKGPEKVVVILSRRGVCAAYKKEPISESFLFWRDSPGQ